jgi:spore coat polysaccharide biosynthesis protein SpsF
MIMVRFVVAGPLAIVQARMSSTRLPGKVLADLEGEPMLELELRRLSRSQEIGSIVIATTTEPGDDPIEQLCADLGYPVYRGSRDDVLERFVEASASHRGPLVRITADCPLIDPGIVDDVVRLYERSGCVYASTINPRTFPVGLDTEVFSVEALRATHAETRDPNDREHVTEAIIRQPERFPAARLVHEDDLSALRWTVDYANDLEFVRRVVVRLGPDRHRAGMEAILAAIRREPSLASFQGRRG